MTSNIFVTSFQRCKKNIQKFVDAVTELKYYRV